MATTIAVSDETKRVLERIRPRGMSMDHVVSRLLASRPPEDWRDQFEFEVDRDQATAWARRAGLLGAPSVTRSPSEQVLLAKAARWRYDAWRSQSKVRHERGRRLRFQLEG